MSASTPILTLCCLVAIGAHAAPVAARAPAAQPTDAETTPMPSIEMESTSVNIGIGGRLGAGILRLPNLGTNCTYSFKVSGFGAGLHVGVSKARAEGVVANLTKVADLSGRYSATTSEATLIAGAGSTSMKNDGNNVVTGLKSRTEGLGLCFGGQGMTIDVAEPDVTAPKTYILTFGFNKSHVNQEAHATLDRLVRAWKCHYVNIRLYGNTDTVGKESINLNLLELRALAVRDYLVRAGVLSARVQPQPKGESSPIVPTGNDVRLRNNRNVIAVIQE